MIIVCTPEGGEPEHYDARSLRVSEASIASRTADMKWGDIRAGLADEDLEAMRVVAWVLKKRQQPSLRYGDFDPGIEEMVTRLDKDEVAAWVEGAVQIAAAAPDATVEELAAGLAGLPVAALDREHAERLITKAVEEFEASGPKEAPSPSRGDESPSPTSSEPEPSTSVSSCTSSTSLPQESTT